jgi:sulfite exporter TauE/SafE
MPFSTELLLPGFIMGLAGSLHCVGMCGPLALSLPVSHNTKLSRIAGGLIYNSGRIFSYTLMGFVFGSIGNLIIAVKWQNGLSIALGVVILVYLLTPKKYFHFTATNVLGKLFMVLYSS